MSDEDKEHKVTGEQIQAYCEAFENAMMKAIREFGHSQKLGIAVTFIAAILGDLAAKSWRKQFTDAEIPEVMASLARASLVGPQDGQDSLGQLMCKYATKEAIR